MRQPIAFGFYPFDKDKLDKVVSGLLKSDEEISSLGVIVPHAGYSYSGAVAGKTYATAKTSVNKFLLLGPNHSETGAFAAKSLEDWYTPFGIIFADKENLSKMDIVRDEQAHEHEHSLEVQLPFLQKCYDSEKGINVTPIVLRDMNFDEIKMLAKKIDVSDSFCVCSSDFIHFGPSYNYQPVSENCVQWVKEQDSKLLKCIESLDAKGFYDMVKEQGLTVCGASAISLMLVLMKGAKAKTIAYSNSYDVTKSDSFVSYAGVVFYS